MPAVIFAFFVSIAGMLGAMFLPAQAEAQLQLSADAAATNVFAYKSALVNYLLAHPSTSGTIADASITLPSGMVRNTNWTNTVSAGVLYVYEVVPSTTPGLIESIFNKTGNSILVGRASGGQLVSPRGVATGITLPVTVPAIPGGSIVMVGM